MSRILVTPKIKKVKSEHPERFIDITIDSDKHLFSISIDNKSLYHTHNCDGGHIATLLTNLFCRWFPYVVDEGRLYRLLVPLVSVGTGKSIEYFYDMEEFKQLKSPKNVRYLKGLGSLSPEDWDYVMKNKKLQQIKRTDDTMKYLSMAFDSDSGPRKNWLKGETF